MLDAIHSNERDLKIRPGSFNAVNKAAEVVRYRGGDGYGGLQGLAQGQIDTAAAGQSVEPFREGRDAMKCKTRRAAPDGDVTAFQHGPLDTVAAR
jgi:hypothetical protein